MHTPDIVSPEPVEVPLAPSGGDTVPLLRADLLIGRGEAPGAFEVREPEGGGAVMLLEAEVSVARMLDGRRTVDEVIAAAERLGIPVDPDGLGKFVRGLERQGLLAPRGAQAPVGTRGRPGRKVWDAATRERFRAAVRLLRTGQPEAALPLLRALVADDPDNVEAQEQLALIAAGHALAARPIGEVFADREAPRRRRRPGALALAATGVALAGLLALAWRTSERDGVEARVDARAERPAAGEAAPRTAAAGTPAALAASVRTAPVERRWHPALAELRAPAGGVVTWQEPLPSRVTKGERIGELRSAAAPAAPGPEARARLEELERLAKQDPVYQEFLEKERAARAAAAAAGTAVALVAPAAGGLALAVRGEAHAAPGEVVARVVDPGSWRVAALLRGTPPAVGSTAELAGDGEADRAVARVVEVRPREGEAELILSVPSAQAPWLEGARAPYLRLP